MSEINASELRARINAKGQLRLLGPWHTVPMPPKVESHLGIALEQCPKGYAIVPVDVYRQGLQWGAARVVDGELHLAAFGGTFWRVPLVGKVTSPAAALKQLKASTAHDLEAIACGGRK